MANRTVTSGKHPLIVRVTPEDYRELREIVIETQESVNEFLARYAHECAERHRGGKDEP